MTCKLYDETRCFKLSTAVKGPLPKNNPELLLYQSQKPASVRYGVYLCRDFTVFLAEIRANTRLEALIYCNECTAFKKEAFVVAILPGALRLL